jgi:endonuclease/exonuclease/phosphatase family metal-dependent hydrolase
LRLYLSNRSASVGATSLSGINLMKNQPFQILTYNIHKGFNVGNRRFVLPAIRRALREINADLMCLQEVQGQHLTHEIKIWNWPDHPQTEFIAQQTWSYHAYGKNAVYSQGNHGNALLSKFPLESWENINVSPYPWASRSLLHAVIPINGTGQQLHIICLHLGLLGTERRRQVETLCQRIESHVPDNQPLIVAGDFNDWRGSIARQFYQHLHLKEVFQTLHGTHARTFPCWMPLLPMDRIYYRGLHALQCERLKSPLWQSLSDHAPLLATFQL